jgi:hypothetical protein
VTVCWYCGRLFDDVLTSGKRAAVCDECWQIPVTDGTTESAKWAYALAMLQNHSWTPEEEQMLADSSLGVELCETIIQKMDRKCLAQLMRKCVEPLSEANVWL